MIEKHTQHIESTFSAGLSELFISPELDLQVRGMTFIFPKAFWGHGCHTDASQSKSDQTEEKKDVTWRTRWFLWLSPSNSVFFTYDFKLSMTSYALFSALIIYYTFWNEVKVLELKSVLMICIKGLMYHYNLEEDKGLCHYTIISA